MKFYLTRTYFKSKEDILCDYPQMERFIVATENDNAAIIEINSLDDLAWILNNVNYEIVLGKTIDFKETVKKHRTIYKELDTLEIYDNYRE